MPFDEIRRSLLFRTLRGGKEKKLSRALTETELVELEGTVLRAQSKVSVGPRFKRPASRPASFEAARAGIAALPQALLGSGVAAGESRHSSLRGRRRAGRHIENVSLLVRNALAEIGHGPKLPPYARRTSALYVQQEDLDALLPDGWGAEFPTEIGRVGRAVGLPPAAIPLLCLLQWTSSFREPINFKRDRHECGAGFQVSLDWLARKMGCSRVWVQQLINRLDPYAPWRRACLESSRENRRRAKRGQPALPRPAKPTGTAFIHRFRRLKRYEDTCPEAAKRRVWVDDKGKPHLYVDVRGVVYLTSSGRKLLCQRRRVEASTDLAWRTRRVGWLISARLRRGHDMGGRHMGEVLENRRELGAAPGPPKNLSPNNPPQKTTLQN